MNKEDENKIKNSPFLSDEAKAIYKNDRERFLKEKEVVDNEQIKKAFKLVPENYVFNLNFS